MFRWLILGVPHIVWGGLFIYLYNSSGSDHLEYDTISVALTTIEVILVVFGLASFGFIAVLAEKRAKEAAEPVANRVAKEVAEAEIPPEAARQVLAYFERLGIDWNKLPRSADSSDAENEDTYNGFADALAPRDEKDAG